MRSYLYKILVLSLILFGTVSYSLAESCADDPSECTPKKLCEIATEVSGSNKLWSRSESAAKHVQFALEIGINCGVSDSLGLCQTDPNECKISDLCSVATSTSNGTIKWNKEHASEHVKLAKEYGLKCEVASASKVGTQERYEQTEILVKEPKNSSITKNLKLAKYNDELICKLATTETDRGKIWASISSAVYVNEANARNLTCGLEPPETTSVDAETKSNENSESLIRPQERSKKLTLVSDSVICLYAVNQDRSPPEWENRVAYQKYVEEAHMRGLRCELPKAKVVLNKNECHLTTPEHCSKEQLCKMATFRSEGLNFWRVSGFNSAYVHEAKRRKLTCGVKAQVSTCAQDIKVCDKNEICSLATVMTDTGKKWASSNLIYILEAKKRVIGWCNVRHYPDEMLLDIRKSFINTKKNKRLKLQYALKELGLYTFSIDGIWGNGTARAFKEFVTSENLPGYPETFIFDQLLKNVKVPNFINCSKGVADATNCSNESICQHGSVWGDWSSFAGDQKFVSEGKKRGLNCTTKSGTSVSRNKKNSNNLNTASASKKSAQGYTKGQAKAICQPKAQLLANETQRNNSKPSGNNTITCKSNADLFTFGSRDQFGSASGTTRCRQSSGDSWPGLIPLLLETDPASKAKRAAEDTFKLAMKSCMAQYGWY